MQEQTMSSYTPVSEISTEARASFISKTYSHVAGAILLFTVIEIYLFSSGLAFPMAEWMLSKSWLLVLGGAFYLLSKRPKGPERMLAERYARGEIDEEEYRERLAVLRT